MAAEPRRTKRQIPEHWQLFMDQKGIRSIAHLAELTGIAGMTANRLVMGDAKTRPDILRNMARALRVDDAVIYGLAGWPTTTKPWEPPAEAEAMTERQRKAVTELIRSFVLPALAEEPSATVHQLRPAETEEYGRMAAWRRDEDDRPTFQEHLDGLGEEPQD